MAAQATAQPERLTWDEICQRYPDEWVVLVEFDRPGDDMDLEFQSAVVIAHRNTRRAASPDVKEAFHRYDEVGTFWTGDIARGSGIKWETSAFGAGALPPRGVA